MSWLNTRDHKRIGVMFLAAVIFFFFARRRLRAARCASSCSRPGPFFVDAISYNRLFTLHGVVMIFLFLIPAIPAAFGNFVLPLMIGARDVAFPAPEPRLASTSTRSGAVIAIWGMVHGGADTGWTFYTPVLQHLADAGGADPARRVHPRLLLDPHRPQLHRHRPHAARARA